MILYDNDKNLEVKNVLTKSESYWLTDQIKENREPIKRERNLLKMKSLSKCMKQKSPSI